MELAGLAYDGLEALEMATATRPDIIVLDITMPYLDGIGVLERLGQLDLEPRPKVIILTAFEQESMIQRLIGLGASYYMVKPFDVNTLFERIRQFSRLKDGSANVWEERPKPAAATATTAASPNWNWKSASYSMKWGYPPIFAVTLICATR